MAKVVVNDGQGLVQKPGSGSEFAGSLKFGGAVYTGGSTTTAAATPPELGSAMIQLVDSTDNAHKVKMPLAAGAGQVIIVCNVDAAEAAVIRNNADDTNLGAATAGASMLMVSTAAGDNWAAHESQ